MDETTFDMPLAGESQKCFAAFIYYRSMKPKDRSLRKGAEAYYGSKTASKERLWQGWSAKFHWVERARAWDLEQDRLSREAEVEAIREMRKRHAEESRGLQSVAIAALSHLQTQVKANPDKLRPGEILAFFMQAAQLERISMGVADQTISLQDADGGNLRPLPVVTEVIINLRQAGDVDLKEPPVVTDNDSSSD